MGEQQSLHVRFQDIVHAQRGWKTNAQYVTLHYPWMMLPVVGDSLLAVLALSLALWVFFQCATPWSGVTTLLTSLLLVFFVNFWWPAHQHKKALTRLPAMPAA